MTEAIFSLIGVIVGALLSGGVAFLMAKRTEKQKARAAARQVRQELRYLDRWLATINRRNQALEKWETLHRDPEAAEAGDEEASRAGSERDERIGVDVAKLTIRQWTLHAPLLAEVLSTSDWNAISDEYESIRDLHQRQHDREYQPRWGGIATGWLAAAHVVMDWDLFLKRALNGMPTALEALDRLADGPGHKQLFSGTRTDLRSVADQPRQRDT